MARFRTDNNKKSKLGYHIIEHANIYVYVRDFLWKYGLTRRYGEKFMG
jgi:hypothetical protein